MEINSYDVAIMSHIHQRQVKVLTGGHGDDGVLVTTRRVSSSEHSRSSGGGKRGGEEAKTTIEMFRICCSLREFALTRCSAALVRACVCVCVFADCYMLENMFK